jgi:molecular chaperone GrpE
MIKKVIFITAAPVRRSVHATAFQRPSVFVYGLSRRMMSTDPEKPTEPAADAADAAATPEDPDVVVDPMVALTESNKALENQVKEMRDKMLRALADEENVRRIAKRDVENARTYANTKFAKSLLDVSDNLERALEAASGADAADHAAFTNLVEGVKMTHNQLTKVFESHGVIKYGAVGDVFDPKIHDALFRMPDPTKPEGTIGQILKCGYTLHDRVIRAAEVGTITGV